MIKPIFIIAFSGHRPNNSQPGRTTADLEACRPQLTEALQKFKNEAATLNGCIHLLASAAEGADAIAIEIAKNMGIPVHIILPMDDEKFLKDFEEGSLAQQKTRSIIRTAREGFNGGTLRVADSGHRPDCYAETNLQMIASADALLVLWNGEAARGTGGTAEVWQDASHREIPRIHINPATHQVDESHIHDLTNPNSPGIKTLLEINTYLPKANSQNQDSRLDEYKKHFSGASDSLGKKIQKHPFLGNPPPRHRRRHWCSRHLLRPCPRLLPHANTHLRLDP